jgi:hypothetical protein
MDIEELSKSQLILLTILVNFVTSVATGILTVSLLDHAPPIITQTVNRVVERTIETVAQAAPAAIIQAPAPSNQDLVTKAIGLASSRAVILYPVDASTTTPPVAHGTFLPKSGVVVTATAKDLPKEAIVAFATGESLPVSLSREGEGLSIYGFADDAAFPKVSPAVLMSPTDLRLGETTLALTGDGFAATGIVSRVSADGVHTTLPNIGSGSAVVNLAGNIIGIGTGDSSGLLISANKITAVLTATSTLATSTPAKSP